MNAEKKVAARTPAQAAQNSNFKPKYNNKPRYLQESNRRWIENIPKTYRQNYKTAIAGRSRTAAIKAMCLDCMCWQRVEITNCSIDTCPLFSYRPYRSSRKLRNPQKSNSLEDKTGKG